MCVCADTVATGHQLGDGAQQDALRCKFGEAKLHSLKCGLDIQG